MGKSIKKKQTAAGKNTTQKTKVYHFHKLLRTFTKFYYSDKNLVYKYNSTCRDLNKKRISHPCFYGDVINKAKKFKSGTSKLVKKLEKSYL